MYQLFNNSCIAAELIVVQIGHHLYLQTRRRNASKGVTSNHCNLGCGTVQQTSCKTQDILKMEAEHSSKCRKEHITLQSVITTHHTTVCHNHTSHYSLS